MSRQGLETESHRIEWRSKVRYQESSPVLHFVNRIGRSLIALSLIMALLQFKPAPMYILDEVDAALDLSHTQNIGRLIKTRFKGSQFIVVSLKDGMFQNANRIFRTRFSEGTSVVQALTPADFR